MAFNRSNKNGINDIRKALEEAQSPDVKYTNIKIKKNEVKENKARYQFMLQPSIRKKIDKLAKDNNYSSSSEFLNELIKQL